MKNESKNMPKISKDFGRKALSLLMAATLVISEIPTQAIANGVEAGQGPFIEEAQQTEPETTVEEAPAQREEAAPAATPVEELAVEDVAKVTIDFDEYTSIKYTDTAGNERAIDFHMTEPLNLPANKEFKFTVETVDGYVDPKVEFELNGNKDKIEPDEKGEYTLSAADVATGLVLKASATKAEGAEDEVAAEALDEAGITTLDLSDLGDGTISSEMLAENKTVERNEKALSISIQFVDADGNGTDATLNKTVYVHVKGNNNQKITLPLQAEGSALTVPVKGLLDQNGNKKNDGSYYDLTDDPYEVTLFTTNDGGPRSEGWNYDPNNITVLTDGVMLGSSTVLHLPDAKTVSQSAPYVATAKALAGGYDDVSYAGILGDAINFGIVANVFSQNSGDAETNVAAKIATCTTQTGNDLTNAVEQTFMFGQVNDVFRIKGENAFVVVPASDASKVQATGSVRLQYDTTQTADQINAAIDGMIGHASAESGVLASMLSNAFLEKVDGSHYKVDVRGRGAGAYVLNLSAEEYQNISKQNDDLRIYKDDNQTVVFNVQADGSLGIWKYSINGVPADSLTSKGAGSSLRSVVFNFPNAKNVTSNGSVAGIFLAPKATWNNQSLSAGWIVCDKFIVGSGEWHNNYDHVVKLSSSASFKAKKNIDGVAAPACASGFSFTLERVDGKQLSVTNTDAVRTVKNFGDEVNLGLVTYTVDDLGTDGKATYVYKITEVGDKTTLDGKTYANDTRVVYAKVDLVEKNTQNNGVIEKDVAVTGPVYYSDEACTQPIADKGGLPIFNNRTQGRAEGGMQLKGSKSVRYADGNVVKGAKLAGFTFTLSGKNGAPMPRSGQTEVTTNDKGEFSFNTIDFTAAGTYEYELTETAVPSGYAEGTFAHMVKKTIVATVTDGGNGKLNVSVSVDGAKVAEGQSPYVALGELVNIYKAEKATDVKIEGTKDLTGRAINDGEFKFELVGAKGDVVDTATNKDGKFTLSTGELEAVGTYEYTVREAKGTNKGITYDTHTFRVKVEVTDPGDGQLVASVSYLDGAPEFKNSYAATGSLELTATKVLTGGKMEAGEFQFEVVDEKGVLASTATNDVEGNVKFSPINYDLDDLGDHTYTVSEVAAQNPAISYDTAEYDVAVNVSDNGDGTLAVQFKNGEEWTSKQPAISFKNAFFEAKAEIGATKYFYGPDAKAEFAFELKTADDQFNVRSAGATTVSADTAVDDGAKALTLTATNGAFANGVADVKFPQITYYTPGTYHYVMSEAAGNGATDAAIYHVTVDVAKDMGVNVNYQLVGEDAASEHAVFYNNANVQLEGRIMMLGTEADQIELTGFEPEVQKELVGATLSAGEFAFDLVQVDEKGQPIEGGVSQTQAVNADGEVAFDYICFDAEGTYRFAITEKATSFKVVDGQSVAFVDAGITYDNEPIYLDVVVTRNADGTFESEATYTKNGEITDVPTFINTRRTVVVRTQKRSKEAPYEPLQGAVYGLWMLNPDGNDVYLGNQTSDEEGWITFDVPLHQGVAYYFKEEQAPAKHLVDPVRSDYFTLVDNNGTFALAYEGSSEFAAAMPGIATR